MPQPSFLSSLDYLTLNAVQREIARAVAAGHTLIVSGGSRTGKTHLASVLGRIFHAFQVIRACDVEDEFHPAPIFSSVFNSRFFPLSAWTKEQLKELSRRKGFVIDHAASLRPDDIDRMSAILQKAHENNLPFGGAQVVLLGDFCALPPLAPAGEWGDIYRHHYQDARYAFDANAWGPTDCRVYTLTEYFLGHDSAWIDAYKTIRLADVARTLAPEHLHKAVSELHAWSTTATCQTPAVHCCQYASARERLNNQYLHDLPGRLSVYKAKSKGSWDTPCPELSLKPDMPVMFTRDIPECAVFRGMMAVVTRCTRQSVFVTTEYGHDMEVPLMQWLNQQPKHTAGGVQVQTVGERSHYPLVAAYAVLPHQLQGRRVPHLHIHPAKKGAYAFLYDVLTRADFISGWPQALPISSSPLLNASGVAFSIRYGAATQGGGMHAR